MNHLKSNVAYANNNVLALIKILNDSGNKEPEKKERFSVPDTIPKGARTSALVQLIGSLKARGLGDAAIWAAVEEENQNKCNPPLTDQELKREVKPALERGWEPVKPYHNDEPKQEPKARNILKRLRELDVINCYPLTDLGASKLFADVFSESHRYNQTAGDWFYFNGVSWILDRDGLEARASAKRLCDALRKYAGSLTEENEDKLKAFFKFCGSWSSSRYRSSVVNDSRDCRYIKNEDLDSDDYLLNVKNGTLRLAKGQIEFKEHSPEDLQSKVANVVYDPEAKADRWLQFLDEIMIGDQEKIKYLQKLIGICLTGNAELEKMWFLYGSTTRNGKSCFIETISYMLGTYAVSMRPESLAIKNNDSRTASGDIARLSGTRLVICSEIPKRMPLDTGLLKSLTGRDVIVARHLHQSEFEFTPKFKLLCNTNYLPLISDLTVFKSDRITVIGFDRHFTESEQDKQLKNKLKEELSGILNWAIEGLKAYYDEGLNTPDIIGNSTEDYASSSDKMGNFINDELDASQKNNISVKEAYEKYNEWCDLNGYHTENKANFIAELKAKGIFKDRGMVSGKQVRNIIAGYAFKNEDDDFVEIPKNIQEELPFT